MKNASLKVHLFIPKFDMSYTHAPSPQPPIPEFPFLRVEHAKKGKGIKKNKNKKLIENIKRLFRNDINL